MKYFILFLLFFNQFNLVAQTGEKLNITCHIYAGIVPSDEPCTVWDDIQGHTEYYMGSYVLETTYHGVIITNNYFKIALVKNKLSVYTQTDDFIISTGKYKTSSKEKFANPEISNGNLSFKSKKINKMNKYRFVILKRENYTSARGLLEYSADSNEYNFYQKQ